MTSKEQIAEWLKRHSIREVECLVPDIAGNARGKFIPTEKFLVESSRMPEGLLAQTVTGEFPNSYWELIDTIDGDMLLEPDLTTACLAPWAQQPTAQIIHDCYTKQGQAHPFSSRTLLKRVLQNYQNDGLQPVVAPEMEFFLVQSNRDPIQPLEPPVGRSGRQETARQSYSIDATNEFKPFINSLYSYGEEMKLDIDVLIHESGAAQFEINFAHGDPLKLADQVFLFKRLVREVAFKHHMHATFMAKPMADEPGSSKHIHQSLISTATGENIFATKNGDYSKDFFYYMGGLQTYIPAVMSLFAPNVNSYRRFGGDSAPINLYWGYDNRSTGLRVPDASPSNYRIENRCPGADVNPYLSFAATLACGYLGIQKQIEPSEPYEGNAYKESLTLPRSLHEALGLLQECDDIADIFGGKFIEVYSAVKSLEFEQFNQVITPWEREHLLLRV